MTVIHSPPPNAIDAYLALDRLVNSPEARAACSDSLLGWLDRCREATAKDETEKRDRSERVDRFVDMFRKCSDADLASVAKMDTFGGMLTGLIPRTPVHEALDRVLAERCERKVAATTAP